jgi:hypothetical protein
MSDRTTAWDQSLAEPRESANENCLRNLRRREGAGVGETGEKQLDIE